MHHRVLVVSLAIAACSAPPIQGTPVTGAGAPFGTDPNGATPSSTSGGVDPDSHARAPDRDGGGGPGALSTTQDMDGDGVPDAFDCDPGSSQLGAFVLDDDLASAKGNIEAAPGFDPAAWVHAQGAYQQQMLRDAADASFFTMTMPPEVLVDVHAMTTQTGTFSPTLHQQFLLLGASASEGQLQALGCGVEFVEGNTPMGVASIVGLSGPPSAVRTTPLKREARPFLPDGQEYVIEARLSGGTLTCSIIQGETTTTVAAQVGQPAGAIGFYTHQTAGLFKQARICALN